MTTRFSRSGEDEDTARRRYDESEEQKQVPGKQTSTLRGRAAIPDAAAHHRPRGPDLLPRVEKHLQLVHTESEMASGVDAESLAHTSFGESRERAHNTSYRVRSSVFQREKVRQTAAVHRHRIPCREDTGTIGSGV